MEYTVQKLAELAGVSARTLRYYDSIGLLCPRRVAENDYRLYGEPEVDLLQQILFYRALGFPLSQIASLLRAPDYDRLCALRAHEAALTARLSQTEALLRNLTKTINTLEGKATMTDHEKFEGFKADLVEKNEAAYGAELREKYGEEEIAKSNAKMMKLTEAEYAEMERIGAEILTKLAAAIAAGKAPESDAGREIAALHQRWLGFTWAHYTPAAHKGLIEMYLLDERFTAFYEKAAPGAARFLRDAVSAYLG